MSEFEARLTRSLANSVEPPDEAFVANITDLVAADERARLVRLAMATAIAIALAGLLCYGIVLTLNAIAPQSMTNIAGSVLCTIVALLALPLALARE